MKSHFRYVVLHVPKANTLPTVLHHQLEQHVFQDIFSNTIHTKCTHVNQMHNDTSREMHDLWSENMATAKVPFLPHLQGWGDVTQGLWQAQEEPGSERNGRAVFRHICFASGSGRWPVSVCSENCRIVCRCAEVLPRNTGPRDTAGLKPYRVLQGPLSSHSLKPEGGMPTLALSALSKTQLGCLPGWPTFVYKDHIWSLHELIEFSIIYFSPKLHRMATQVLLKSHLDCYLQQVNSWRL